MEGTAENEKSTFETWQREAVVVQHAIKDTTQASQISHLKLQLERLRNDANGGLEWWPQYDVRRSQTIVKDIELAIDVLKQTLQPRSRFRFRSAVTSPPPPPPATEGATPSVSVSALASASATAAAITSGESDGRAADSGEIIISIPEGEPGRLIKNDKPVAGRAVHVRGAGEKACIRLTEGGALSIRATGLTCCTLDTNVVNGSVWIHDCKNMILRSTCRQLRVHQSHDCTLLVDVVGRPVIEACSGLRFGPRAWSEPERGRWGDVSDMSWLRESKSDNWRDAVPEDENDEDVLR